MVEKEQCSKDVEVIVNDKKTKWNLEMGCENNGLMSFSFKKSGFMLSDKSYEIPPFTYLILQGKPKRVGESGVQILYKIKGDDDTIYASWWINFKHNVDLILI